MNLQDKVAVVTGASSGIGRELAGQLVDKGCKVVLAARNQVALEERAKEIDPTGDKTLVVQTDVSKRDQMNALVDKTMKRFGRLDVFINNAGVSLAQGTLVENSEQDVRATMDINTMAGIYSVWAAFPAMKMNGGGQLVFVSSCVGKRGIPFNAVYCASKFAIQGLTESIRPELKRHNIRVITMCPPGVDTPFFENNKKGIKRTYRLYSAEKIARMIVQACEKEKREVLMTMDSKLLHWLNVFFPGIMDWAIAKNKGL